MVLGCPVVSNVVVYIIDSRSDQPALRSSVRESVIRWVRDSQ